MSPLRTIRILRRHLGKAIAIVLGSIFYSIRALLFIAACFIFFGSHTAVVVQGAGLSIIIELIMQLISAKTDHNIKIQWIRMMTNNAFLQFQYEVDKPWRTARERAYIESQLKELENIGISHPGNK